MTSRCRGHPRSVLSHDLVPTLNQALTDGGSSPAEGLRCVRPLPLSFFSLADEMRCREVSEETRGQSGAIDRRYLTFHVAAQKGSQTSPAQYHSRSWWMMVRERLHLFTPVHSGRPLLIDTWLPLLSRASPGAPSADYLKKNVKNILRTEHTLGLGHPKKDNSYIIDSMSFRESYRVFLFQCSKVTHSAECLSQERELATIHCHSIAKWVWDTLLIHTFWGPQR